MWRYFLSFNQNKREDRPRVVEEQVTKNSQLIENRNAETEKGDDPLTLTQTLMEQISRNKEYRELYNFFASIRYSHIVPQIVRDVRRETDDPEDPFSGDFLKK